MKTMLSRLLPIVLVLGGLVACAPSSNHSSMPISTATPTVVSPSPSPEHNSTPKSDQSLSVLAARSPTARLGLSDRSKLALNGIGNIRVGMTVSAAEQAAGVPLISRGKPAPGSLCSYVVPGRGTKGLSFMLDYRSVMPGARLRQRVRIVRIDVFDRSPITTLSGAKIGDSEARIKSLYPGQIEVSKHKYLPTGHYLTYVPKDEQDRSNRLIFETDGNRVTAFRAGKLPEVSWVEGCS